MARGFAAIFLLLVSCIPVEPTDHLVKPAEVIAVLLLIAVSDARALRRVDSLRVRLHAFGIGPVLEAPLGLEEEFVGGLAHLFDLSLGAAHKTYE